MRKTGDSSDRMALPTEVVFAKGSYPREGGIAFKQETFKVFSEWTEVSPTDQTVATEYSLQVLCVGASSGKAKREICLVFDRRFWIVKCQSSTHARNS